MACWAGPSARRVMRTGASTLQEGRGRRGATRRRVIARSGESDTALGSQAVKELPLGSLTCHAWIWVPHLPCVRKGKPGESRPSDPLSA